MPIDEFPGNSKSKPVAPQPAARKIEPVVTGKVTQKKQPLSKKFASTFFGGDVRTAGDFIIQNVLIPSAQRMIMDAITGGVARVMYRDPHNNAGGFMQGRPPGATYTPYGKFSVSGGVKQEPVVPASARTQHNFSDIILEDRVSAERVIEGMYNLLNEYEVVTVSDFYSLLGVSSDYTDQNYGWTDLRGSDVRIVPQGYMLVLPKPKPIKR